ncbi:hypothetical protein [Actinotalea sp. C106]|uniref:hypothetical protein n=1 Tax=Actinotalea sp. C106 TaxID=2908644 RepID=UPI0035ABF8DF
MASPPDGSVCPGALVLRCGFGVRWSLMSRVEDLAEAERAARVAAWAAAQEA